MTLEGQPPPEDKSPSREVGTSGPGIDDRPPGAQPLLRDDPKFLGSYELHWRLGVGTSGVTYLAESNVGDVVVVKLLWPHIAQDSSRRAQIFRDIESLGAVSNERFVRLLEADPAAQPPWFAMEYVPGPTLKDFVAKHGPLRDAALQDFADDLAAAVQDVHRVGIILRNLTPDDIVMANPGPRIIDFGAARLFDVTQLTNSGSAKGIPGWMAPEQLTLDPVTRAVDVHAWALCVLFAATGLAPYQGETAEEAMTRVVWNEPEIPATVPDRLRKALRLALAKRASSRPSLAQLRAGQLPEAITDPETTPSRGHRRKWALTLGAIVVVTAILAALITAVGSMPPSGSAPVAGPSATASETTARVATPAVPPQVEELTLSADSQIVEVGQGFMLRVQTMPLVAGASLVIEESSSRSGGAGGWHPIASLRSDQGGQAEWFQAGVSRSGIVEFRVSHPTGQGSQILSGPIAVTIQKRVTASVVAKWPSGPAEYCGEQEIPVRLVPPEPGRLVELQYSSNGQLWQKADDAPANQGGEGQTPGA